MVLSDLDISKFQELYKTEFGINLSKEIALQKGIQLLNLVSTTYKPMTMDEYKNIKNNIKQNKYDKNL